MDRLATALEPWGDQLKVAQGLGDFDAWARAGSH
jgi:hypothetical protein